jgi:hypothetical protein
VFSQFELKGPAEHRDMTIERCLPLWAKQLNVQNAVGLYSGSSLFPSGMTVAAVLRQPINLFVSQNLDDVPPGM